MGGSITKEGDVFIDAVPFAIVDLLISRVGNVQVVSVILLCLPQNEAFSQHYLIYRWIWWISSTPRFVFSLRVGCQPNPSFAFPLSVPSQKCMHSQKCMYS
jgi:hypothetical protein